MKTAWDYTKLASAYLKRPNYSDAAIEAMLSIASVEPGSRVCDVGAGVAHLTIMLATRGLTVTAIEPNAAMRSKGTQRTRNLSNVKWHEGTGEDTGQHDNIFDLVTFGSSFNVCDRQKALQEAARILKSGGWFSCMWNHRDLTDPIQSSIEAIIKELVPSYGYGTRREDQTDIIKFSGLFSRIVHLDARIVHEQKIDDCAEAWRSHATLERQAGDNFYNVVAAIEKYLKSLQVQSIQIVYSTNIWMAQLQK